MPQNITIRDDTNLSAACLFWCIIQDFISWISSNILLALSSSLSIAIKIQKSGNYQPTLDNSPSIRSFVYTNLVHHIIKSHTSFYALIFLFLFFLKKVDVFINGKYMVRYAQFKHATTPIILGIHNWNVKFIFPLVYFLYYIINLIAFLSPINKYQRKITLFWISFFFNYCIPSLYIHAYI